MRKEWQITFLLHGGNKLHKDKKCPAMQKHRLQITQDKYVIHNAIHRNCNTVTTKADSLLKGATAVSDAQRFVPPTSGWYVGATVPANLPDSYQHINWSHIPYTHFLLTSSQLIFSCSFTWESSAEKKVKATVQTNLPVSLLAQKSPLSPFYEHTHHHYNSCFTDEPRWAGSSPAFFLPLFQREPLVDKWLKFYCTSDALPAAKPTVSKHWGSLGAMISIIVLASSFLCPPPDSGGALIILCQHSDFSTRFTNKPIQIIIHEWQSLTRNSFYLHSGGSICTSRPFSNTTVSPCIITFNIHNPHISHVGSVHCPLRVLLFQLIILGFVRAW